MTYYHLLVSFIIVHQLLGYTTTYIVYALMKHTLYLTWIGISSSFIFGYNYLFRNITEDKTEYLLNNGFDDEDFMSEEELGDYIIIGKNNNENKKN